MADNLLENNSGSGTSLYNSLSQYWNSAKNYISSGASSIGDSLSNFWNGTPNYTLNIGGVTKDYSSLVGTSALNTAIRQDMLNAGITEGSDEWNSILNQTKSDTWGQNTGGVTGSGGFVNSVGGWGNVIQGIGTIGNLYTSLQALDLQRDALSLAQDQYNMNKKLNQVNLDNSVSTANASIEDRLTTRAKANTGDSSAYDDLIAERKLSSTTL